MATARQTTRSRECTSSIPGDDTLFALSLQDYSTTMYQGHCSPSTCAFRLMCCLCQRAKAITTNARSTQASPVRRRSSCSYAFLRAHWRSQVENTLSGLTRAGAHLCGSHKMLRRVPQYVQRIDSTGNTQSCRIPISWRVYDCSI